MKKRRGVSLDRSKVLVITVARLPCSKSISKRSREERGLSRKEKACPRQEKGRRRSIANKKKLPAQRDPKEWGRAIPQGSREKKRAPLPDGACMKGWGKKTHLGREERADIIKGGPRFSAFEKTKPHQPVASGPFAGEKEHRRHARQRENSWR